MNYFNNVFIFLLIIIKSQIKGIPLIIPFESPIKKDLTPDNYFSSLYTNELKITLKVGSHQQSIPCYLNLNSHTVYISGSDSELKNGQPKYQEYKSTKYTNISDTITSESFYVVGMPSKDEIRLNDNQVTELKFYLAKSRFSENELIYSCMIGLGYEEVFYDDDDATGYLTELESFITQMKNNNIINKKVFFIKYNDNNENGEIVFGTFPHEIKDKYCESCEEEDFIEGGFIIGSYSYKKEMMNSFFNDKISEGECFTQEIYQQKRALDVYYCKKNVDITKIEKLIIVIDKIKYKIEFSYSDLFTLNGDYLYFNVLFTQDEDEFKNDFILGKPVFKKYPLVFRFLTRNEKIGFYNNFSYSKKGIIDNNIDKEKSGGGTKLTIILIVIGIIIICLLSYIIFRYYKKPRKTKVNELIEFFDYSAKQGNI